jgi:MFS family permease
VAFRTGASLCGVRLRSSSAAAPGLLTTEESALSRGTLEDEPSTSGSAAEAPEADGRPRRGLLDTVQRLPTFDALHSSVYRLLLVGQGCTSMGMWMDQLARGWLLYQLTSSPLQLGLLQGLQALPLLLLSPVAGAAADRFDRKLQMVVAPVMDGLQYAVVALLILTDLIEPWHVYASAFLSSTVSTFHNPARTAMISDAVPHQHLTNAIALTSVSFNVSRSVGPAMAGVLIALYGTQGAYVAQAGLCALAALVTLPLPDSLRFSAGPGAHHARSRSFSRNILEGWRFSWSDQTVRASLLIVTSASLFILPFTTMLPVYARDILAVGASGQGVLLTAMGIGAFCSSVLVASIGDRWPRGILMLGGVTLYGLSVLAFAASSWFSLSVAWMVIVGVFHVSSYTLTQVVVQTYTPAELRGRTMGILQQVYVVQLFGGMVMGALATVAGAPFAVAAMAVAGALTMIAIALTVPVARRIR